MNDIHGTIERVRSANPVPSPNSFPTDALSSPALLSRIDERSTAMTDTLTPIRSGGSNRPPGRNRGLLIAAAAAAAILIIGVVSFVALNGDDGSPAITDQPTTTEVPSTTVESQSPLPADTPPLDVVAAFSAALSAGDMAGAEALIRPDSPLLAENVISDVAPEVWYRMATGAVVDSRCSEATPPELQDLPAEGVIVTCDETITSGLQPGTAIGGGRVAFQVKDGWILDLYILPGYVPATDEDGLNQYRNWMRATHRADYDELFILGATMVVGSPEARARHQELIPLFLAETAGQASQSTERTPAPTAGELAAGMVAALDAKDSEALRALSAPESNVFVYQTNGVAGTVIAGVAIDTWNLATDPLQGVEMPGDPIVSGSVLAFPVAYTYPDTVRTGFEVHVLVPSGDGLLFGSGAVVYAEPGLQVDGAEATAIADAFLTAWNADDLTSVMGLMTADPSYWSDPFSSIMTGATTVKAQLSAGLVTFTAEYTGDPVVAGPFVAVPSRLTDESRPADTYEGVTFFEIRDGKIALFFTVIPPA